MKYIIRIEERILDKIKDVPNVDKISIGIEQYSKEAIIEYLCDFNREKQNILLNKFRNILKEENIVYKGIQK